ncbi:TonB-dependent siderophore receptor [Metapseudomonas furukawaii]|uniref:Metal-pseudopaline receptor CntO n=1 Tax=Metapseudomonas furukawaii TaxID=1149133 RepID=A0AAD1BWT2_METFU|nr:TonB-dependent receptor [Pseudomonas furukawaii]ELS25124.1 Ferrichrome-iron receptor [Pseudomonas furukawaii]BAU71857.1 ferrichrome-iron receptor [Pseudomonas furukawaii]
MKYGTKRVRGGVFGRLGLASLLLAGALSPLAVDLAYAAEAGALASVHDFDIPAQPLPRALDAFSRVTGFSVVYTLDTPLGLEAPAVAGRLSASEALARLLAGSGFSWRQAGDATLTLEPRRDEGALTLDAVTIDSRLAHSGGYQPPPDTGITRASTPLLEIPQAVAVVPAQALQDQQPQNLDDALANVSGITQANTLGGTMDAVMKRGFGDNRDGSILRDGMRTIQGRNLTATAERVEVLKGPSSMLYGILDPGGVINVIGKKPQLEAYRAITARASSYGDGKDGSGGQLDLTGPLGENGLAYRLIADYDDGDYWRNFGHSREKTFAPSLAWFGEETRINLSFEHREYSVPFDRGTVFVNGQPLDVPAERRLDEPYNVTEGRSDLAIFDLSHQLGEDWTAHFAYSYNRDTYDDYQARVTRVNTDGTLTRRLDGTRGAVSTSHFATFDLAGEVHWGGMQHDLLMGVDHEYRKFFREDLIRQTTRVRFDPFEPVYGQVPVPTTVAASDSDQTDRVVSQSAFFQDSLHLTERWILVAGARYQLYDQLAGRGRPFSKNTDIDGQLWVPRAGLVYKWSDELSLYGGYSESFKPNSTIAPLSGTASIDGLDPEEGKSWEIGAKLDLPGRITGTLALFDIVKENVLVTQSVTVNGLTDTVATAAGEVRSRGLELDLTGQLTDSLSLIGTYAFTDAEVTEDPELKGNRLQNVARHSGSLSAVYDFGALAGNDRLRAGLGARYVGERSGDAEDSFDLDAYTLADAFASYETPLGDNRLKLQLNLKNLFDKTYYSSSVNALNVSIGDPRQVQLSTTLEF